MKPPRSRARAVFRIVEVRQWNDVRINEALPPPPPNARFLYLYLQSAPSTRAFPGLYQLSLAETAERFGWSTRATARELARIVDAGLVRWDAERRVVWVLDAIAANAPASPNAAKAWAYALAELPECPIVADAREKAREFLRSCGEAFAQAFAQGLVQARAHPCCIQDQDQDQEQILSPPASAREAPGEAETETETEPASADAPSFAGVLPTPSVGSEVLDELRRAGSVLDGADLPAAAINAAHACAAYGLTDPAEARRIALEAVGYGRALAEHDAGMGPSLVLVQIERKVVWLLGKRAELAPPSGGGGGGRRSEPAEKGTIDPAVLAADTEASARRLTEERAQVEHENAQKRAEAAATRARLKRARDAAPAEGRGVFTPGNVSLFGVGRPSFARTA